MELTSAKRVLASLSTAAHEPIPELSHSRAYSLRASSLTGSADLSETKARLVRVIEIKAPSRGEHQNPRLLEH
jgi:hypothetical protein